MMYTHDKHHMLWISMDFPSILLNWSFGSIGRSFRISMPTWVWEVWYIAYPRLFTPRKSMSLVDGNQKVFNHGNRIWLYLRSKCIFEMSYACWKNTSKPLPGKFLWIWFKNPIAPPWTNGRATKHHSAWTCLNHQTVGKQKNSLTWG